MTTPDVAANLVIGVIGGVIASILTLLGDRWLHRANLKRRLSQIEGDYFNWVADLLKLPPQVVVLTRTRL